MSRDDRSPIRRRPGRRLAQTREGARLSFGPTCAPLLNPLEPDENQTQFERHLAKMSRGLGQRILNASSRSPTHAQNPHRPTGTNACRPDDRLVRINR